MRIHLSAKAVVYMASYSVFARAFASTAARSFKRSATRAFVATSTETMTGNPLLEQEGLPKFDSIEPKHLTPAVESLLEKKMNEVNSVVKMIRNVEVETDVCFLGKGNGLGVVNQ